MREYVENSRRQVSTDYYKRKSDHGCVSGNRKLPGYVHTLNLTVLMSAYCTISLFYALYLTGSDEQPASLPVDLVLLILYNPDALFL